MQVTRSTVAAGRASRRPPSWMLFERRNRKRNSRHKKSKLARKGHICDENGSNRHFGATNRTISAEAATEKATAQARRGILCPRWFLSRKNFLRLLQERASRTAQSSGCPWKTFTARPGS